MMNLGLQQFADGITETTTQVNTQPQAASVDKEAIFKLAEEKASAAAEKKAVGVVKSVFEQNGFDAESINAMTSEWKSRQKTPEQLTAEKDAEITDLRQQLTAEQERVQTMYKKMALSAELEKMSIKPGYKDLLLNSAILEKATLEGEVVTNAADLLNPFKESHSDLFIAETKEEKPPAQAVKSTENHPSDGGRDTYVPPLII